MLFSWCQLWMPQKNKTADYPCILKHWHVTKGNPNSSSWFPLNYVIVIPANMACLQKTQFLKIWTTCLKYHRLIFYFFLIFFFLKRERRAPKMEPPPPKNIIDWCKTGNLIWEWDFIMKVDQYLTSRLVMRSETESPRYFAHAPGLQKQPVCKQNQRKKLS